MAASHSQLGERYLYCEGNAALLFTENETNNERLFGRHNVSSYVKEGINNCVVNGKRPAVNPEHKGTKAAADYQLNSGAGETATRIFLRDESGRRPVYGATQKFQTDPHWKDYLLFYKYFHGDNGAGLGASHQTGWTGLVAALMGIFGRIDAKQLLEAGRKGLFAKAANEQRMIMSKWPKYPTIYEINTWVWLSEISEKSGTSTDLSSVPSADWDAIAAYGFDAVWLMGVWERSPAGIAIANRNESLLNDFRRALPDFRPQDNVGSPYCVRRYVVDKHLGGPNGLAVARQQLAKRGMRLILDFVPNHVAPDHPWVVEHPEYFIRGNTDGCQERPCILR